MSEPLICRTFSADGDDALPEEIRTGRRREYLLSGGGR